MRKLENIFWLGTKELRSFFSDFVLLALIVYAFSLAVIAQAWMLVAFHAFVLFWLFLGLKANLELKSRSQTGPA